MTARTDETTAGEVARRRLLDGATVEEHTIESSRHVDVVSRGR